eukprot:CAMPEP_0119003442 /NCGR_PEP_ID=MMETSP1176-20130426/559_1 /TAXON_ID=265551 /ORGANISM="Synedropsis recta cf, Strain CCMP1620" /LENGTH=204 /DNA_ID=CAMNT_0006955043 /DNA_START=150 /DNA_END=764 /DNA_ORIENTATION=+
MATSTTTTTTLFLLTLSLLLALVSSFHITPVMMRRLPITNTALHASTFPSLVGPGGGGDHNHASSSEIDAHYLLAKAQECAFSDSATLEDATYYLRELMHIESGCVVGTLASRSLCENQEQVADIVQHLQGLVRMENIGAVAMETKARSSTGSTAATSAPNPSVMMRVDMNGSAVLADPPLSLQLLVLGVVSVVLVVAASSSVS